ncbi:MAG: AAA-like domain-containing protein [Turicibacter sp.]|nr:AAA-like domain-containing protein [Turicibacter sp.]
MKEFNVTGLCVPHKHFMVDISDKLNQIEKLIDEGRYFTINRGRQYGKTTTLSQLRRRLVDKCYVISISFEGLDEDDFKDSQSFCMAFMELSQEALRAVNADGEYANDWVDSNVTNFRKLGRHISKLAAGKKVILMIDEVDKVKNNTVFINFLSLLRQKFLAREDDMDNSFQSVILAGVHDIKNIKLKMINDGIYIPHEEEGKIQNSPWNIAVNFDVEMKFSPKEIATMLTDYESFHHTQMDIPKIAEEIYYYTNGYPYLVSRICQIIHKDLSQNWSISNIRSAVSMITKEDNELFKDLTKNLESNKTLYDLLYDVLILGRKRSLTISNPAIQLAAMYGYIHKNDPFVRISNRIFEMFILDHFNAQTESEIAILPKGVLYREIVSNGNFNMELCLTKFAEFFNHEIFPIKQKQLLELQYRMSFLSYLKPLLNGIGHIDVESELIDERRMDVSVKFGPQEFIIELKRIFDEGNRRDGIQQLLGYMESRRANEGYFLTFDFRVKSQPKVEWLEIEGRRILEISV